MLSDVFGEIEGKLINGWHPVFYDIENILGVFDKTLCFLDALEPFEHVCRVVDIDFKLLANKAHPHIAQCVLYVAEYLNIPNVALKS